MKRSPIKPRSAAKARQMRAAVKQIARLIDERGDWCQMPLYIHRVDPDWRGCTGRVQGRHHLLKQSAGTDESDENMVLSCNPCNDWVESWPALARSAGLVG